MLTPDRLAEKLHTVHQHIAEAAWQSGRDPSDVTLIAVTKYAELEWVRGLYDLGVRDFGESRPQQLVERAALLPADVRWHLIGHLQRNKAALVLPHVALIHSVDSLRLAKQLSSDAVKQNRTAAILLEVNVSGEQQKDGFAPDDLRRDWPALLALPQLSIQGLMTMAPLSDDAAASRPHFQALRTLRDELQSLPGSPALPQLSMGMSGDYEAGITEGATYVRVGSALFDAT